MELKQRENTFIWPNIGWFSNLILKENNNPLLGGGKTQIEIDLTLLTWYCHSKVKSNLSKEKDMQAYLGEHLQVELMVLKKSATRHAKLRGVWLPLRRWWCCERVRGILRRRILREREFEEDLARDRKMIVYHFIK